MGVGTVRVVVGVVGTLVAVPVAVGGCTAGSDFSPQPDAARAANAAAPTTSGFNRRLPAEPTEVTAGTVTKGAPN